MQCGDNVTYLSECIFDFLPAIDFDLEWELVKPIVTSLPWLCWRGLFLSEKHYRQSINKLLHNTDCWNNRSHLDQVYRARYWLGLLKPSSKFNRRHDSYALKHYCERWWQPYAIERSTQVEGSYTVLSPYVSNGCLILGALSLGWKCSFKHRGKITCPNIFLRFSEKSLVGLCPHEVFLF